MMKLQESETQPLSQITTLFDSNHTQIRILISNGHKAKEGNGLFDLNAFIIRNGCQISILTKRNSKATLTSLDLGD